MTSILKRYWFLIGLLILLPLGITLGCTAPFPGLAAAIHAIPTLLCTGGILFLMSVTLDTGKLVQSLRRPFPVLTACSINMILIPLMCLPLLALQQTPDLKVGLLIVASVPCTLAAASVWTRKALGNDAVSLLVTLLTNGTCFLLTPAWMEVGRILHGTADMASAVSFTDMMLRLTFGAMIPAVAGQMARNFGTIAHWVDGHTNMISIAAQAIILTLVLTSSFKGGEDFDFEGNGLPHIDLLLVWACCIAVHLVSAFSGWWIGGVFGFADGDRRAIVFAGSQKTLPIGLIISDTTGMPLSIIPMLMFHGSQLVIDTWIADRMAKRDTMVATAPDPEG